MKIGIVTFQWADNYGAVLQAHALQSYLQERGHDVQIVDYRVKPAISFVRRWLAKTPRGCVRKWEAAWKTYLFEAFRRKHLKQTPEVFHSAEKLNVIADRFDLLITGSDQVWNPRWLEQVDGLFDLCFLSFAGNKTKRISYAASIGHSDTLTMTDEWKKILSCRMKEMDAISVRERSSVSLVQELSGRTDAIQVADPTLLLDRSYYEGLATGRQSRKRYLFSYMLHGLEQDAGFVCNQISEKLVVPVIQCNARQTRLHRGYRLPSPTGWLGEIRDASFVVTNSFHATVFCLIFHVPFIAVLIDGQIGSMNSRITDLLNMVGLGHRICVSGEKMSPGLISETIDWDAVVHNMSAMRAGSVDFLVEQGL